MAPQESGRPRQRSGQHHKKSASQSRSPRKPKYESASTSQSALSSDALLKLDRFNQQQASKAPEITPQKTRRKHREVTKEKVADGEGHRHHKKKRRRDVSGALLEEGEGQRLRGIRGGARYEEDKEVEEDENGSKKKKRLWMMIGGGLAVVILIIIIAVVVSKKNKSKSSSSSSSSSSTDESGTPSNSNLNGISASSIPTAAKGTYLDPFSWYDTTGFNVTYTNETVGGLPIMGLNTTYDNSKRANSNTVPISSSWGSYATTPVRGVNLGGWLSLEPFITPSLFNYDSGLGIIDEYTLTTHLGSSAQSTLEKHYATFVTEQTFIDIANAGLDHVRIPFSYWAVTTYDGDPYVFRTSWRYLLRGIEWARKHGLRINLDLHGLPGSQNGWNHSGRQGDIGWLNGSDGDLNAQRSLDIHNQLSQFFAQDRYKNIISFYGLANEPKMTALNGTAVLDWTAQAYTLVKNNGLDAYVVFGDGFMGLANWQGKLTGYDDLVLDAHQYVIFNTNQIDFNHTTKINYACSDWTSQSQQSISVSTGFGPTIFAEWSQADTDCATNLNNVGIGNRWEGTYDFGDAPVLTPRCPLLNSQCECTDANAAATAYSTTYKQFLKMFAEAQMKAFEAGWGWFYWTWVTEDATQWSYQLGLAAGILPTKAYAPDFECTATVPAFAGLPEYY